MQSQLYISPQSLDSYAYYSQQEPRIVFLAMCLCEKFFFLSYAAYLSSKINDMHITRSSSFIHFAYDGFN